MSGYKIWSYEYFDGCVRIGNMKGISRVNSVFKGKDLSFITSPVSFDMDPDHPIGTLLGDNVGNSHSLDIVSEKLKDCLDSMEIPGFQYVPVTINDYKGKPVPANYFMLQITTVMDAIDFDGSDLEMSPVIPSNVFLVKSLVIDEEKIDKKIDIFRMKGLGRCFVVSNALAEKLARKKFEGLKFIEVKDFKI